jgi:tetratricopeptide (TPR) repeat protein
MAFTDRYGLTLSTASRRAAEAYCRGLDHALAAEGPAEACFREARLEDPGFALAHIAEARLLQFRGLPAEARAAAERAHQVASGATTRERQHVDCLATAIAGDPRGALAKLRDHLADYPRDALVLSQATGVYGLIGFSGRPERNEEQLALLAPLATHYGDDWWFLSQLAFACNELFRHDEARRAVERSLAGNPRNGHASHTVAHIAYETGDAEGGAAFLREWLQDDDPANQLYVHNHWHLALFELAAGNFEQVLDLYDRVIRPSVATSPPLGTIADAASLLWRCTLTERPAGALPWEEVAAYAAAHFPRPGITWADAHCLIAWCAVNDEARLATLVGQLRDRVAGGKVFAGPMLVILAEGYLAFARREWSRAANLFQLARPEFIRLGGSHAQREVFEETLIEACARAGRLDQARALLEERLDRRPNGRDRRWLEHLSAREAAASSG